jgi:YD repeat-containing protein
LRTALNPESGTISYQYDDNGNLIVKTDARNASAHYEYDALNRATRRWYNGSNSISATTHNSPAVPAGVGATDEVKFFYDSQSLPTGAPSYTRGAAVGRLVAQTYGTGSNGDYYGFDVQGRATFKFQQTGTFNYQLSAAYSLSGSVNTLTYPSGHTITNSFDQAGRLTGLNGNLGDGTTRIYASGILYSPIGGLEREQFGTTTPIYHKLFYNSRGQLFDNRVSSINDMWDWNRGRLILYYSSNHLWGQSGTDNNGNVRFAETWIPPENATLDQAAVLIEDSYNYDALNRLTSVTEQRMDAAGGWVWQQQFRQAYTYDRYGNRTIDGAQTWGTGINNKAFTVNTANNRLGVPGGQPGVMSYDLAGNLTNDTYTGAGNRTYDGENKITSAWGGNNQAQLYAYDGSGQRIRRTVDGVQTWQVYGFGGELVAEYAANSAVGSPQKEYGYRKGELLVTATPGSSHSLSGNGTSSYTQAPSSSSLNITGSITLEAWIKINALGAPRAVISREAFQQSGTGGGYRLLITDTGRVRLDLFQTHNTYVNLSGAATITTGVWHHVAGVFNGTQMRVYLNGVLDGSLSTTSGPTTGTGTFHIGRFSYSFNPYYFNGLIDDARVSNAALYTSNFTPSNNLTATGSTKGLLEI